MIYNTQFHLIQDEGKWIIWDEVECYDALRTSDEQFARNMIQIMRTQNGWWNGR